MSTRLPDPSDAPPSVPDDVVNDASTFVSSADLYWRARRALTEFLITHERVDEEPWATQHRQLRARLTDAARDYRQAGQIFFQIATTAVLMLCVVTLGACARPDGKHPDVDAYGRPVVHLMERAPAPDVYEDTVTDVVCYSYPFTGYTNGRSISCVRVMR
jgi:hypothetical protein